MIRVVMTGATAAFGEPEGFRENLSETYQANVSVDL